MADKHEHLGANLLGRRGAKLRELANGKATPEARAEVEAAYQSKWWSLRVLAIRAIGRWGGKADKAWLIERAGRALDNRGSSPEDRWQAIETKEARRSLVLLIAPRDHGWALDLCLRDQGTRVPDTRLLARIPDAIVEAWIETERARGDPARLAAVIRTVYALRLLSCRWEVLDQFTRHENSEVAKTAQTYLGLARRLTGESQAAP